MTNSLCFTTRVFVRLNAACWGVARVGEGVCVAGCWPIHLFTKRGGRVVALLNSSSSEARCLNLHFCRPVLEQHSQARRSESHTSQSLPAPGAAMTTARRRLGALLLVAAMALTLAATSEAATLRRGRERIVYGPGGYGRRLNVKSERTDDVQSGRTGDGQSGRAGDVQSGRGEVQKGRGDDVQNVRAGVKKGRASLQRERTDVQRERNDVQKARVGVQKARVGVQRGRTDVQRGRAGLERSRGGVQRGRTGVQKGRADVQKKRTGVQRERASVQNVRAGVKNVRGDVQSKRTDVQQSGRADVQDRTGVVVAFETPEQEQFQYGRPGEAVFGAFSWRSPEGVLVVMRYVADAAGYRVTGGLVPEDTRGVAADGKQVFPRAADGSIILT
ncbi:uncharacterized protein LOC123506005 [Portunus trituberculatus]|uniref:uncharacterized protein LOC123506005 n=1 Tax=Portunus trituberculatus TaxID=210409 RepID=UPI001E1D171B|nr:uncharacterized protein LOC123506005 [Portunus trituberculatus]